MIEAARKISCLGNSSKPAVEMQLKPGRQCKTSLAATINNAMILVYLRKRLSLEKEISKYEEDSDEWMRMRSEIYSLDSEIRQLTNDTQSLFKEMRNLRWVKFNNLQNDISNVIEDMEHIKSLLNSDGFFDDLGKGWNLTSEGMEYLSAYREGLFGPKKD